MKKKTFRLIPFVVFLGMFLFVFNVLSNHEWNARSFILERSPEVPLEQGWNIGYDGQWSYLIALDPWGAGSLLDQPAYRYQRILYPLLAHSLTLGWPPLIPWAMLAINVIATVISSIVLGTLLARRGASPWLALVFFFSFGYLLTIRMDLLEPMTFCLSLSGWLAYECRKPILAVVLFALSGLTKETGLIFPAAIVLYQLLEKKFPSAVALSAGSFAPYLIWFLVLAIGPGVTETQISRSQLLLIPFWGLRYLKDPASRLMVGLWVLVPAIVTTLICARDLISLPRFQINRDAILVIAQVALIATLPFPTWEDPIAILRTGLGLLVAVFLFIASSHRRMLPFAAALWAPSGLLLVLIPGML